MLSYVHLISSLYYWLIYFNSKFHKAQSSNTANKSITGIEFIGIHPTFEPHDYNNVFRLTSHPTKKLGQICIAATPPSPSFRSNQAPGPYILSTLKELVDEDRWACISSLRKFGHMQLEREDNILRNHLLLEKISCGTFEGVTPLPQQGVFAGRTKISIEELNERRQHEEEAERMRVEAEEEFMDVDSGDDGMEISSSPDSNEGDNGIDMSPPPTDPGTTKTAPLKRPPVIELSPIILPISDTIDEDVEDLSWDSDVDTSKWYPSLISAFAAFKRGRAFPRSWIQLINSFIVFEQRAGFVESGVGKLKASPRPKAVADFLQHRRDWTKSRPIEPLRAFRDFWWAWWKINQPPAHLHNGELVHNEDIVWDGLQEKCGNDGMILVISTLLWWGEAVFNGTPSTTPSADQVDSQLAVDNMTWALEHMLRTLVTENKQATALKKRLCEDKENISEDDTRISKVCFYHFMLNRFTYCITVYSIQPDSEMTCTYCMFSLIFVCYSDFS